MSGDREERGGLTATGAGSEIEATHVEGRGFAAATEGGKIKNSSAKADLPREDNDVAKRRFLIGSVQVPIAVAVIGAVAAICAAVVAAWMTMKSPSKPSGAVQEQQPSPSAPLPRPTDDVKQP